MDQPLLSHNPLQQSSTQGSVSIMHHMLRDRLPDARPGHFQHFFAPVQEAEVVPDVQIARLEDELELVRVPAQNLLKLQMREARFFVLVVRREQGAGQIRMPADALYVIGGAGLHDDGRADGRLIQGVSVEAGYAANGHGRVAQMMIRVRGFVFEGFQRGEDGHKGILALAFETVEALNLDGVVVEGVIGVWKQNLRGVVVWQADFTRGVVGVRGDVEGLVGAADRVDEDRAKEAFEDESIKVVDVIAFVFDVGTGKIDDFYDSGG